MRRLSVYKWKTYSETSFPTETTTHRKKYFFKYVNQHFKSQKTKGNPISKSFPGASISTETLSLNKKDWKYLANLNQPIKSENINNFRETWPRHFTKKWTNC